MTARYMQGQYHQIKNRPERERKLLHAANQRKHAIERHADDGELECQDPIEVTICNRATANLGYGRKWKYKFLRD